MAGPIHVWEAQSKSEARKAYVEADAQHELVNEAYRVYYKAAMAVAKLFRENDNLNPKRDENGYSEWMAAVRKKEETYKAWQREAHIHGQMFVPLMDKPVSETTDSKEPW